ncbi:MAG: PAS domain-containing protein [Burkholderiaceae bacterium]|nr:PAS domain-containing protein [Burkholderiaceae bacterium]
MQRLALITAAHGIGVWEIDPASGALRWNAQMHALHGTAPREAPRDIAEWLDRHLLPVDRERVLRAMLDTAAGDAGADDPRTERIEHRIVRADGVVRWLESQSARVDDVDGRPVVLCTSRDISARKEAEQRLHEALQRLQLATDLAGVGVFVRDYATGLGYWNPQMFALFGVDPAPYGSNPPPIERVAECLAPEDRMRYLKGWSRDGADGDKVFPEALARVLRPDGSERHMLVRARRIADGGGFSVVAGVVVDITDRVASEQRAAMALQRLELASRAGRVGIADRDLVTGEGHWNPMLFELTGLPLADTPPTREALLSVVHPDDRDKARAAWARAAVSSEVVEYELRMLPPDGSQRWVLTHARAEHDSDGRPLRLLGTAIDLTPMRRAEQERNALLERLELAMATAQMGVWERELPTLRERWDTRMCTIYGVDPAGFEPSRSAWLAFVHPDDRAEVERRVALMDAGGGGTLTYRIVRADGAVRWIDDRLRIDRGADGSLRRVMGVHVDITDRREVERERDEVASRLQLATRVLGFGHFTWWPKRHVSDWSDQMYTLLGHTRESFRDRWWTESIHPEDRAAAKALLDDVVERGLDFGFEYRSLWPDGSVHWIATRGHVERDAQGRAERVVGMNWDITESKLADSARRARDLAERASAAKSEFLSRMSHELRTPLNAILGFTQLLDLDPSQPLTPVQRDRLGHIKAAGQHLLSLINEVLDLSRIESGTARLDRSAVDLADIVTECIGLMTGEAQRRGIALQATPPVGGTLAWADAVRCKQVLLNLLSNAIKYNREAGQVTVGLVGYPERVTLSVRDTGRGLTPRQLDSLCQPFNRLGLESAPIEGTGIGLMITLKLVQQMGGSLDVSSEPGIGSEFRVTLPAASASASAAQAA